MPVLVDHDVGSEELEVILCELSGYCQEIASYVHSTRHLTLSLSARKHHFTIMALQPQVSHNLGPVTVPSILSSGTCLALLQGSSIFSSRETECSDALL
jgi:hypothetical protein